MTLRISILFQLLLIVAMVIFQIFVSFDIYILKDKQEKTLRMSPSVRSR